MIYANDPPKPVKALMGIAAVMTILLTGVTLGVLTDADPVTPISSSEAGEPRTSPDQDDGLTRPVLRLDDANRRAMNRGAMAPCSPHGQQDANADAEPCSSQPMQIDKRKMLVLLALWRILS